MLVTRDIIFKGQSSKGGWSKKQLLCLGLDRFEKGWIDKLICTDLDPKDLQKFLNLKDAHLKKVTSQGTFFDL